MPVTPGIKYFCVTWFCSPFTDHCINIPGQQINAVSWCLILTRLSNVFFLLTIRYEPQIVWQKYFIHKCKWIRLYQWHGGSLIVLKETATAYSARVPAFTLDFWWGSWWSSCFNFVCHGFVLCLYSSFVWCAQCCQCLWIFHSWSSLLCFMLKEY